MKVISVDLAMSLALLAPLIAGGCACGRGSSAAAVHTGPQVGAGGSYGADGSCGAGGSCGADGFYGADSAPTSTGPKYYISDCQAGALSACIPGDDSNAGTSPDAPWRTVDYALNTITGNTPPGQQYLFARGGSFLRQATTIRLADFASSRNNPLLFDAYTPSWASDSSNRPIITATTAGLYAFDFENGGNAVHDEGYVIRNLDLRGGGIAQGGIFLFNDVDYVLMENLSISGFGIGLYVAGANTPNPGSDGSNDYFTLKNSTITNNAGMGFLGQGSNFVIENNVFDNNGFAEAVFNHNIYVTAHVTTNNSAIRNNTLTHSTIVNGTCSGASLVVHGDTQGLIIESNRIQEDIGAASGGCYGIAVDPGGYGVSEGFPGTIIRGNRVINVGGIGIGASACPNCVIENNVIVQEQSGIGFIAVKIPVQVRGVGDAAENSATIRNNSIYVSSAVGNGTGIYMGYEGTNHLVVSNAIHYLGPGDSSYSGWACFDTTGLTASSFEAFDNNLCDFPNAQAGVWERTAGSLTDWRATGLDSASLQADPLFLSPGSPEYDLSIPAGSRAVDAGNLKLSSPVDITGRTRDARPDIGAYEYVASH